MRGDELRSLCSTILPGRLLSTCFLNSFSMDCAKAGVQLQSSEWSWGDRVRQANDKETGKVKMVENAIKRMKQGEVIEIGGVGWGTSGRLLEEEV